MTSVVFIKLSVSIALAIGRFLGDLLASTCPNQWYTGLRQPGFVLLSFLHNVSYPSSL